MYNCIIRTTNLISNYLLKVIVKAETNNINIKLGHLIYKIKTKCMLKKYINIIIKYKFLVHIINYTKLGRFFIILYYRFSAYWCKTYTML